MHVHILRKHLCIKLSAMAAKKKISFFSLTALKNINLECMASDYLYHLGINVPDTKNTEDLEKQFGNVKFILIAGTKNRTAEIARYLRSLIQPQKVDEDLEDLVASGQRYVMFKVGPVLCCNHGIGMPSTSILLHELFKLVRYAKCQDPIFIRMGTCGGLGLEPGTVVVSKDIYNGYLRNEYELAILGERVARPSKFDSALSDELLNELLPSDKFQMIQANTMSVDCFYEGQARLDGAICSYGPLQKQQFMKQLYDMGIRNIEMETLMFAALTFELGLKAAAICVTLVDRLKGDQIEFTPQEKAEFERRPQLIVGRYLRRVLNLPDPRGSDV